MTRSNRFKVVILTIAVALFIWIIIRLVPDEAEMFSVKITVNCDDVQTVWCNYSLNGSELGSTVIDNVNPEAPLPFGEVVSLDVPGAVVEDPRALRTGRFEFSLAVFDTDGGEHPVTCEGNSFTARFGSEYPYALTCENGEYLCAPTH